MYITESFCYTPEANTLQINYTSIKKNLKRKGKRKENPSFITIYAIYYKKGQLLVVRNNLLEKRFFSI